MFTLESPLTVHTGSLNGLSVPAEQSYLACPPDHPISRKPPACMGPPASLHIFPVHGHFLEHAHCLVCALGMVWAAVSSPELHVTSHSGTPPCALQISTSRSLWYQAGWSASHACPLGPSMPMTHTLFCLFLISGRFEAGPMCLKGDAQLLV